MSIRRIMTSILAVLVLTTAPLAALAGETSDTQSRDVKYYDASGRYQGRTTSDGRGQAKSYDKSGHYQGKAVRQGHSIKIYDKSGRYQGRVTVR